MAEDGAIWVGLLDMDNGGPVIGVKEDLPIDHTQARVLIRMHGAPLGQISLPALPVETLAARAREDAQITLGEALRYHTHWDNWDRDTDSPSRWMAHVSCPRNFSSSEGAGVTIIVCTRNRTNGL